ncbi:unnamed protein product, partial [Heterosigma akashiwo]
KWCYHSYDEEVTYYAAVADCEDRGMFLPSIHSSEQDEFLAANMAGEFWLGFNDIKNEGEYQWQDGTKNTGYTNWNANHTRSPVEETDCAVMTETGDWKDSACDYYKAYYVCAWVMTGAPTEAPTK